MRTVLIGSIRSVLLWLISTSMLLKVHLGKPLPVSITEGQKVIRLKQRKSIGRK